MIVYRYIPLSFCMFFIGMNFNMFPLYASFCMLFRGMNVFSMMEHVHPIS